MATQPLPPAPVSVRARREPTVESRWARILAQHARPRRWRSTGELTLTLALFAATWVAALAALSVGWWLSVPVSIVGGLFLVRLFVLQHDCGHGSFYVSRRANDLAGMLLSLFTPLPYHAWKRGHAIHHATSGDLGRRGTGDLRLYTVNEYRARSRGARLAYRIYRHPLVLFVVAPLYYFIIQNRIPWGHALPARRIWKSILLTDLARLAVALVVISFVGFVPFVIVHLPMVVVASLTGLWLFNVQHQFERTYWAKSEDWEFHEAAVRSSSYYDLPAPLTWLTAWIGIHHVHHLCNRIPSYNLPACLETVPELRDINRIGLRRSLESARLTLWDEESRRLVRFDELADLELEACMRAASVPDEVALPIEARTTA